MKRSEKVALLSRVLAGDTGPLKRYHQQQVKPWFYLVEDVRVSVDRVQNVKVIACYLTKPCETVSYPDMTSWQVNQLVGRLGGKQRVPVMLQIGCREFFSESV